MKKAAPAPTVRKTAGTAATRKAPARNASAAPASAKPRSAPKAARKPARPQAPESTNETPVQHITQEEAVAHIQALLDAKRERDRQPPNWPTGEQHAAGTPDVTPGGSNPAPKLPSPEASQPNMAHERGDQQKSKG
ncbi:hypothetical protein [Luteibacter sp. SG786]|uniref:hypothetical protein n=1 Tax=Luteibacter sp. SG786 TaxID=2587130 RepID=UPI001D9A47C0|nr:hypothetical protein [Luteibacter sp. SG786]